MGSDRVSRAAIAAEQLCETLWEALHERANAGDAEQVGALSQRIVEVCGSLTALADAALPAAAPRFGSGAATGASPASAEEPGSVDAPGSAGAAFGAAGSRSGAPGSVPGAHGSTLGAPGSTPIAPVSVLSGPSPAPAGMRAPGLASAGSSEGEHASFGERALGERGAFGEREPGADVPGATRDRTDPDLPLGPRPLGHVPRRGARPVALVDEQEDATEAIEIKDVRSGAHPPVTVAIQRRLERFSDDRTPFTVLLVEVLDAERLRTLRASGDLLRELWAIESAIAEQLRPADTLLREIDGRWWLIAPNTDSFSARELAERLASAARRFAHRGTPLGVVVGIAVCPEHGLDAATLIGHADIDLYAAQAAGRSVGGFDDGEDRSA